MVKYLITTAVVVLYFNTAFAQKTNMKIFNDTNYAIIPYTNNYTQIFENGTPTSLESNDLKTIEKCLYATVTDYNQKRLAEFKKYKKQNPNYTGKEEDVIINLKYYKIQLMPVIPRVELKGSKMVWINCFCSTYSSNWKENIIQAKGGGKCYFNLKINLSTKQYYDFIVNGVA